MGWWKIFCLIFKEFWITGVQANEMAARSKTSVSWHKIKCSSSSVGWILGARKWVITDWKRVKQIDSIGSMTVNELHENTYAALNWQGHQILLSQREFYQYFIIDCVSWRKLDQHGGIEIILLYCIHFLISIWMCMSDLLKYYKRWQEICGTLSPIPS